MSAFKNHRRPKYIKFSKSGNFGNRSLRNIMTLRIRDAEILTTGVVYKLQNSTTWFLLILVVWCKYEKHCSNANCD